MKQYLWIVVLCFYSLAYTQNCTHSLDGTVTDFHDGNPLSGATIHNETANTYTSADINGKFSFSDVCEGTIVLVVSHVGCDPERLEVDVPNKRYVDIHMEHHLEELHEVLITGTSKEEKTSIQQTVHKKQIETFTDKSLGDALNTLSGVSSLNTGNTIVKPMIHGLHSSRLIIINNNVRLFDQEWGDEHAPNIDINTSNQLEVIKGANTLRYGSDAIGGLILVKPKKYAPKDSLFGSTSLSMNSNGLGGNLNSELIKTYKSGYYAKTQGSYKRFGDFKAPDYYLTNSGLKNANVSANVGYSSFEKGFDAYYSFVDNELGILAASHIGNVNDLVTAINSKEPRITEDFSYHIEYPKQRISHHLGKLDAYKRFKRLGKLSMQYDFQINRRKEYDLRRGDQADTPVIDLRLFTTSFQPNLQIDAFENTEINTGFLLRFQQNDAISGTGVSPLIPDFEKYDAGVYATGTYKLNLFSEISAGFRFDFSKIKARKWYNTTDWEDTYNYDELFPEFESGITSNSKTLTYPEFSFPNFSANLGYMRHFSNDFEFFLNYGLASRMPNPSELFSDGLHHSAARIEIGKLTIGKEVSNKVIASLQRNNQHIGFTISPYFNYINDYIQLIPTGITTTIRGAFPVWEYDQVDATIYGVDLDLNVRISDKISYNGNFSWLRGHNETNDIPLINMPAANFNNSITYYNKDLNQLSVSLINKTVLQQKNYPDYNFYTYNAITNTNDYVDISTPPSSYSLFSFNSAANFKVFKTGTLKLEFNIDNIFNTSYRDYLNSLRYFADELGRNVNLKVKINY
ncbi:TonB-dependent receptor [Tamlana agarivorans]|uniref:TonB-dependent receptor n=1 Tax=Pseudotamlana agarivorans TaxID=481183 RepID=A0ACC5UCN0_9FLAO|nr:TonB-dependent receptor plug domain-containing protein [Tamlana agarivorans]MBU2952083.1 TonB-dependent receptor [Tamlana agarivorans]